MTVLRRGWDGGLRARVESGRAAVVRERDGPLPARNSQHPCAANEALHEHSGSPTHARKWHGSVVHGGRAVACADRPFVAASGNRHHRGRLLLPCSMTVAAPHYGHIRAGHPAAISPPRGHSAGLLAPDRSQPARNLGPGTSGAEAVARAGKAAHRKGRSRRRRGRISRPESGSTGRWAWGSDKLVQQQRIAQSSILPCCMKPSQSACPSWQSTSSPALAASPVLRAQQP